MRFQLIDRVLERGDDKLTALKTVTAAEEYLADHFPSFPVLPGVMMLETLVQAGRTLVSDLDDPPTMPLVVREVRNLKYGNMVRPGQSLHVEVTLRSRDEEGFDFAGTGTVEGSVAVKGRFRLVPLTDPANPS